MSVIIESTVSKCINCTKFFGTIEKDNLCSVCYFETPGAIHPISIKKSSSITTTYESFCNNKVYAELSGECIACYNNTNLVQKYSCSCNPFVCGDCSNGIKKCPICHAAEYVEIDKEDLKKFVRVINNNDMSSFIFQFILQRQFLGLVQKYRARLHGTVTIKTFFASVSVICEVLNELKKEIASNSHDISIFVFGFALYPTNLQEDFRRYNLESYDGCIFERISNGFPNYKEYLSNRFCMFRGSEFNIDDIKTDVFN